MCSFLTQHEKDIIATMQCINPVVTPNTAPLQGIINTDEAI